MELLQPADFVLCALALTAAVTGLFRGFSGTLAFVIALAAGGAAGSFFWSYSAELTAEIWVRGAGTLVLFLVAFGIVRVLVKKIVNGMLAQPADAIFGFITGAAAGVSLVAIWAWSGMFLEYSTLASAAAAFVR